MEADEETLRAAILDWARSPDDLRTLGRWLLGEAAAREARAERRGDRDLPRRVSPL